VAIRSPSRQTALLRPTRLRLGFVPLIDAAPLIVARELGYFADEGIHVELERQIGWGNVRDKLTFGRLDASHALVGMPLFSQLGRDWFAEPLVAVMNLGSGGDAITVSRRLADAGVCSAATLVDFIRRDPHGEALVFAHVFSCSMHHYLLREWLANAGIDPTQDVRLRIFPPNQMTDHLAKGHVDGFCVGEPWNTLAERSGAGRIIAITTDVMPNHPEKALVVTRRWAQEHATLLPPIIRALLRACAFCDDEQNNPTLIQLLARPEYLDAPAPLVAASLDLEKSFVAHRPSRQLRPREWRLRSFAGHTTFPSATLSLWIIQQMRRWRQLDHPIDERQVAARCVDTSAYRKAAEGLQIVCPADDFPTLPLRAGLFDPKSALPAAANETTLEGAM
jgi:two-component system, oxyanion-binding sensor